MKQALVKDWMTRDVVTITPETILPEAHRLMTAKRIRRLPVMKMGRLVSIVTLGDVREAEPSDAKALNIWELHYILAQLEIKMIMPQQLITIGQDATIGQAARMMLENKISGIPVIDDEGKLVGIITESDIFRLVVQGWGADA